MSAPNNSLQTPLARARGLGSAKTGLQHWVAQRVTALLIAPLLIFVLVMMCRAGVDGYASAIQTLSQPLLAVPLMALIVAVFTHAKLGLQVVIEDYIHARALKFTLLLLNFALAAGLALAGVFAVLKIALGI